MWHTDPVNRQHAFIVVAATVIVICGPGLLFAYGVFQELFESLSYDESSPFSGASTAQIDLIGTLSVSFMFMAGPFATAWCKRYRPRYVIWLGAAIFLLASMLASVSAHLWQFQLTQGLLLGVGICITYMPAVSIPPTWFDRRRGLAMGIVLAGTGIGGVFWAPVLRALISKAGFRNTLRISGAICSTFMAMAGLVLEWPPSRKAALAVENASLSRTASIFTISLVDWKVATSRKFVAHALGTMLQSAAYYTPVFFFASYARTLGYSQATSASFIALSNAINAIGKVLIGYAADRIGRLNALFLTTMVSSVTAPALWLPSCLSSTQSEGRCFFIAFIVFYGIFASAYVALFPTSLVEVFGVQHFASVNGVLYMARGVATLVGTPLAGALIHRSKHVDGKASVGVTSRGYENASILVGCLLVAATLAVLWVRIEATLGTNVHRGKWRL